MEYIETNIDAGFAIAAGAATGTAGLPGGTVAWVANDISSCQRAGEAIMGKAFDDLSLSRVTGGVSGGVLFGGAGSRRRSYNNGKMKMDWMQIECMTRDDSLYLVQDPSPTSHRTLEFVRSLAEGAYATLGFCAPRGRFAFS